MRILRHALVFLGAALLWTGLALYGGLSGWWMSPIAEVDDHEAFIEAAAARMIEENPGASALVLVEDGQVVQEYYRAPQQEIGPDTLFATASLSKWIAAIGVMTLVESGQIDLDAPASNYLRRWQLPETDAFNNEEVTVRRLLSHTAGLTDGLGFGDYDAVETIPSLEQSLDQPRASSNRDVSLAIGVEPGTEWSYSGGGYLILELLVEEVSGQSFSAYTHNVVFQPLDMSRSTYDFIENFDDVAASYDTAGSPGPHFQYASKAATGLSSTAGDLTRLVQALLQGSIPGSLGAETIESMRVPHGATMGLDIWGLGTILYVKNSSGEFVAGHDGVNDPALNSSARFNPTSGDGYVALVSGHPSLASSIGSEWVLWQTGYPDFLTLNRSLKSAIGPILIGILAIFGIVAWRYFSTN